MEEIGCKCQTFFSLSLRWEEETNYKFQVFCFRFFFSFRILCCREDTWFYLNLTFLKPLVNQRVFLMEMFFLSFVNETMYLCWYLTFFKMVPPQTNFFIFSNLGLIVAQQTTIHIIYFMAGEWHTSCHPISKMHIVGEGPGETLSTLRCLSYLINSFLTDVRHPTKD